MKTHLFFLTVLFFTSSSSSALTTKELLKVCGLKNQPCHTLPFANAYIGGALDLLGTLQENEQLNLQFSCASPNKLFKVKRILDYIEENQISNENQRFYEDKNAMTLVIKYMEEADCV